MKILVTGGEGFTGRYLKLELEQYGYTVVGLTSDVTDYDSLSAELLSIQPDGVIHLAGIAFVEENDSSDYYNVHVIGTLNLLRAISSQVDSIKSIVLCSSALVYGNNKNEVLDEKQIPVPVSDYAVSKLSMEQMAKLWLNRLPIKIVRPFNYTGVGQSTNFIMPKIISHFINEEGYIELGNVDVWREFGDVRFVVSVYRNILERAIDKFPIVNICTGQGYSLRKIINICEEVSGRKINININKKYMRNNEVVKLVGDTSLMNSIARDTKKYSIHKTIEWMMSDSN